MNQHEICIPLSIDPPVITLQLGSKLHAGDIKEGDDVYFECKIDANPKYRRLTWLHNVSSLTDVMDSSNFMDFHIHRDDHYEQTAARRLSSRIRAWCCSE